MIGAAAPIAPVGLATLLRFGATALLIELTPGPNMGYLAIVAAQRGLRAGLVVVAGVAFGLSFYLVVTVAGVAQGALSNAAVFQTLRWSGIAYMLWLALDAWRSAPAVGAPEQPAPAAGLFVRGLLTNLLNVKAAIFYAVLIPGFVDGARGRLALQALMLGCLHLLVATTVHVGIVVLAARSQRMISAAPPRRVGRIYAVALLLVAAWIGWSTARAA